MPSDSQLLLAREDYARSMTFRTPKIERAIYELWEPHPPYLKLGECVGERERVVWRICVAHAIKYPFQSPSSQSAHNWERLHSTANFSMK